MVLIDNYLNCDGDVENDMQKLKHQNLTRMITFLLFNESLSTKKLLLLIKMPKLNIN